ncbi:O-antigen ligase family protein [Puteibacter caeruleilacunae]|nr:O-antigen ligase family protein [Puteibacter caeruleilacunae]
MRKEFRIVDCIYVFLLVFPVLCRWFFLDSWETRFTYNLFNYPLFLPELSFLLMVIFFPQVKGRNIKLVTVSIIGLIFVYIGCVWNSFPNPVINFLGGSDFFLTTLMFGLFPIKTKHIPYLKWILLGALVLLGIEIVLFSTVITYSGMQDRQEYGGITRISSTVGGSTGTAVVLFIVGTIVYHCFKINRTIRVGSVCFTTVAIIFTFSRGALLAQVLFVLFLSFKWIRHLKKQRSVFVFALCLIGVVFFSRSIKELKVMEGFKERFNNSIESGDITSGRTERWEMAYELFKESPIIGNGSGYINPYIRGRNIGAYSRDMFSPHNVYLLCLVDYGIVGFSLLCIVLLLFWKIAYNKEDSTLRFAMFLIIVILMNVEIIFFSMHYLFPFCILAYVSKSKDKFTKYKMSQVYGKSCVYNVS